MRVLLLCFSFLIVFSVYGCSDHGGDFFVSVIVVSKEELISVSGKDVNSYSLWDYSPSGKSCTIFVQHRQPHLEIPHFYLLQPGWGAAAAQRFLLFQRNPATQAQPALVAGRHSLMPIVDCVDDTRLLYL